MIHHWNFLCFLPNNTAHLMISTNCAKSLFNLMCYKIHSWGFRSPTNFIAHNIKTFWKPHMCVCHCPWSWPLDGCEVGMEMDGRKLWWQLCKFDECICLMCQECDFTVLRFFVVEKIWRFIVFHFSHIFSLFRYLKLKKKKDIWKFIIL